jgi:hypothetical protein
MTDLTAMRAKFEATYGPKKEFAWRNPSGSYKMAALESAWEIWQAAWNARLAAQVSEAVDLHAAIMNLPCDLEKCTSKDWVMAFKVGHKVARHAAAELAAAHPATEQADVPTSDAGRFRFEHTEHDAMARIECKAWGDPASVNNIDWWRAEIDAAMKPKEGM